MNFEKMNKLWVKMQHHRHSRKRKHREKKREKLMTSVGKNLVRLSQLESVTLEKYQKLVLPGILKQVVSFRDAIAQEYLMNCIIKVFPDEFHIQTLNPFLKSCAYLELGVNVKNIIISLMERLALFSQRTDVLGSEGTNILKDVQLFEVFSDQVASVIVNRQTLPLEDIISLQTALVNSALKCYPNRVDFIDKVMLTTVEVFQRAGIELQSSSSQVAKELLKLLKIPLDNYKNLLTVLQLKHYASLMKHLNHSGRKFLNIYLLNNAVEIETVISNAEQVEQALGLMTTLVSEKDPDEADMDELDEEQYLLARFIHQFKSNVADDQYLILQTARKILCNGGAQRIKYTLPPLVFQAHQLAFKYKSLKDEKWKKKCHKIFQFCHSTITTLVKAEFTELPLRLFLQGALAIDQISYENHETMAYEYMSQAFSLYEDEVFDSKAQLAAITLIVAALEQISCFSEENSESLRTRCALAVSKLMKKSDQCRGVAIYSHLFWSGKSLATNREECHDGKRVVECLKTVLRIAQQCMDISVQVQLFVELLNHYIYFFEKGNEHVTVATLNQLVDRIKNELPNMETSEGTEQITKHFNNTLELLKSRIQAGKASYEGLVI